MKIDVLLVSEWLISERKWITQNVNDKNKLKAMKINSMLSKYEFFANSTCTGIIISKNLNYKKRWVTFSDLNIKNNINTPQIRRKRR